MIEGGVLEGATLTVRLSDFVAALELASITCTVKLLVPDPVGVPEIAPVPGASVNPVGKFPETSDQVYGGVPAVADNVALYATF